MNWCRNRDNGWTRYVGQVTWAWDEDKKELYANYLAEADQLIAFTASAMFEIAVSISPSSIRQHRLLINVSTRPTNWNRPSSYRYTRSPVLQIRPSRSSDEEYLAVRRLLKLNA